MDTDLCIFTQVDPPGDVVDGCDPLSEGAPEITSKKKKTTVGHKGDG